ncbi:MAG: WHG domain-containing protein [Microthrixaceae bacterium]
MRLDEDVANQNTANQAGADGPPDERHSGFEHKRPQQRRERNPRGEGERLRRELLENALELLSEASHPDDVSIRAIARQTGVSATAAYRHFVDRDDLVYCAIGLAFEEFGEALASEVATAKDPFEAIAAAGRAYRRYAEEYEGRYRVLFSNPMACPHTTTATEEELDAGTTAFDNLVVLVQAALDAGAPAGARGVTAEYLAYQLWTWIHGIVDLRITHPHDAWPDAADLFADAQRLLGLCAPDS